MIDTKCPTETLLDLIDLYTHHRTSTIVGLEYAVDTFIGIRIELNQEASSGEHPRYTRSRAQEAVTNGVQSPNGVTNPTKDKKDPRTPTSPNSDPSTTLKSPSSRSTNGTPNQGKSGVKDSTVRFMLDPKRARNEKAAVAKFFKVEEEEYEVEVESGRRRP